MAGVSVGFAKCFILFMAVVILAQGLVYLGLSIWGITLRDCQTTSDITGQPFKFAMDLIYFLDEECGSPTMQVQVQGQDQSIELSMDWDKSFAVTHREYIFMITYAVVSGLWVASSFLIIFTLCFTTTKLISGTVYWPWFLSVLAGCILDVVATVYHALDITKTMSLQDAFNFVGAKTPADMPDQIMTYLETFGVYFSTPALVMTLLSCRVVLIWLLNLIGGMFCLSLANVLANQAAASSASSGSSHQIQPRQQTPQPVMMVEQEQFPTAPAASAAPSVVMEPVYPEQVRPAPLIIPAQTAEMMRQDSQYPPNDRTTLQSPVLVLPPLQQHQQQQQQQQQFSPQPQPQPDINTYRTTDAHPDQLNYPPTDPTSPRPTSPAVQQLASGSALNSRYSEMYPAQPSNSRVSSNQELRNQMPWSYTSMITKPPPPPRKPQQQVQIYPQIPEPDYTEH
ncbi:uncharacterized protein LOC117787084 [Drosophila innubila]|uniref:uncharacterized protein LOC117787084 n=1 Tax=Drosophila innubila TaxID=198719 RepID=UPI00148D97C7|nr:uncharacterized protein LOC117787084 [Drosophila innubila]